MTAPLVKVAVTTALSTVIGALAARAHRPIFSDLAGTNAQTSITVEEPDVSQVIYRGLGAGQQLWLQIEARTNLSLFVQVGVPRLERYKSYRPTTVVAGPGLPSEHAGIPFQPSEQDGVVVMATTNSRPRSFHEPFTGTDSWILLTRHVQLPGPGKYYVVSFCPQPVAGKLWVSIGSREAFTISDLAAFAEVRRWVRRFHELDQAVKTRLPNDDAPAAGQPP